MKRIVMKHLVMSLIGYLIVALACGPAGAWSAVQMMEISDGVQVTDTTPCRASSPVGNGVSASRRHTA